MKVLLQKCLHSILGSALPYKETGDAEERALANTVTAGGLLLKHLTGKLALLDLLFYSLPHLHGMALSMSMSQTYTGQGISSNL